MGIGARSTDPWREHRALLEAISRPKDEAEPQPPTREPEKAPLPPVWRGQAAAILLLTLGLLWVAGVATALQSGEAALLTIANGVALASGPLALLGIVWLLLRRTSRREARRFGATAAAMRGEAAALERSIAALGERIAAGREALAEQQDTLQRLGEDAVARLATVSEGMRAESVALKNHSDRLEHAAAAARGDMDRLAAALPRAEEQVRGLAASIQAVGPDTQAQAEALERQLAALALHGREAGEQASAAAERLAEQLLHIDDAGEAVGSRIEAVSQRMTGAIEGALAGAGDAVDQTRRGLEAQSAAMMAMIEQAAAALERTGANSASAIGQRLDEIGARIETIASRLAAQGEASELLLSALDRSLDEVETRFTKLGVAGETGTAQLEQAIATLRGHTESLAHLFTGSDDAAAALLRRAEALRGALEGSLADLDALPAALARVEEQAERGRAALAATAPDAARLESAVSGATRRLTDTDALLERHRAAFAAIGNEAEARLAAIAGQAEALESAIARADEGSRALAESAGPQLVEALLRVRETASQATERARETLARLAPDTAAAIGRATGAALEDAVGERVEARLAAIAQSAERAVEATRKASERLEREMQGIAETTAAVEARIEQNRAEMAEADEDMFARRVSLLIESLNSAAIDVTKILSNDVTDSAWTAYLKGDRSIFTRRAVRLVDTTQIREITRHYDEEPEFRTQVNRYIHDFEGMLRRVLASRDGAPLSVTLLSSDMGKLYVALAQAIERLRT